MPPIACLLLLLASGKPPSAEFVGSTAAGRGEGTVRSLDANFAVAWADPATPTGELVALRRRGRPLPPRPRGPSLVLVNGDAVAGTALGGDANALSFRPAFAGPRSEPWAVPLSAVAAVWVETPPSEPPADPARYPWVEGRKQDAALLRNGDVLTGGLDGFTPGGVRFRPARRPAEVVPLDRVAGLAFDPSLARNRRLKTPHARVTLLDGTRLTLTKVTANAAILTGTTGFNAAVELMWADVVALEVLRGKATPLSELTPKAAEVTPYTALAWPWRADRNARNGPLRLRGPWGTDTFDRGLGLHSKTRLTYDLAGKYRRFEAEVGLDAASGRLGNATVSLLIDGRDATPPDLTNLTAASGTVGVTLDTTGVKELTLLVDYGPGGDTQDDVNFAAARLIE
jgi:hypothetical protein